MNGTTENVTHQNDDVVTPTPVWLKMLVFGLGIAIICMLGLILYKIITGVGDMAEQQPTPLEVVAAPVATSPALLASGDFEITRPPNTELIAVVPSGSEVFLHFRGKDGDDKVIIFNRLNGKVSTLNVTGSDR